MNKKVLPFLLSLALCFVFAACALAVDRGSVPLNPDFVKWHSELGKTPRNDKAGGGLAPTGNTPEPVDWSHLGNVEYSDGGLRYNDRVDALPVSFDLRREGHVTSVKDQNPYGTCWAFSALASLESTQLKRAGGSLIGAYNNDLSEMHLAWFTYNDTVLPAFDSPETPDSDWEVLDFGGNFYKSTAMLTRQSGPADENSAPYSAIPTKASDKYPARLSVTDVRRLYFAVDPTQRTSTNEAIKNLLITEGAVGVNYYHDDRYLSNDIAYYKNVASGTNHAVTAVGWDDDYPVANFKTPPPGKGAWLIKNSWGAGFHDGGYFWLSYYDRSLSEAAQFKADSRGGAYKQKYMYDPFGHVDTWGSPSWTGILGANVFTASENGLIEAVAFSTYDALMNYEVSVFIGVEDGNPTSGVLQNGKASGSLTYAGYHTVKLSQPVVVEKGLKFSIVVKQGRQSGTGAHFPMEIQIKDFSSAASANPGESFYAAVPASGQQPEWFDLTEEYDKEIDMKNANFCIRALGNPILVTGVTGDPTKLTLAPGATYNLKAKIAPPNATDTSVVWSGGDHSVATVDANGLLTAVAEGSTVITVTANGAAAGTTVKNTVAVTVEIPAVEATGVEIDPDEGFELYVGAKRQLASTVAPEDASNKSVEWISGNTEVATVDSTGLVTAVAPGTSTITARALGTDAAVTSSLVVTAIALPDVIPVVVDPITPDESGMLDATISALPVDGTTPIKVEIIDGKEDFENIGLSVDVGADNNIVIVGEPKDIGTFELEILIAKSDGTFEKQVLQITINPVDHVDNLLASNIASWWGRITRLGDGGWFEIAIPANISASDAGNAKGISVSGSGILHVSSKFAYAEDIGCSTRGAAPDDIMLSITGKTEDLSSAVITQIVYSLGIHRYTKTVDVMVSDVVESNDTGSGGGGCNTSFAGFALILAFGIYTAGRLRRK